MTAITITHPRFDVVEYIKKLRNAGVTQEVAEIQAQEIEHVIDSVLEQTQTMINSKDLATKGDVRESELRLQKEIKSLEINLQKEIKSLEIKMMTLYGGGFLILLGVLAKGFHWL